MSQGEAVAGEAGEVIGSQSCTQGVIFSKMGNYCKIWSKDVTRSDSMFHLSGCCVEKGLQEG